MKRSLNVDGQEVLRDEDLHYWFLDPDITIDPKDPGRMTDVEPLLVNRVNTWRLRPDAGTQIPNFLLASDYVRTNTDLATMEGANEAARWAVNAILDRSGSDAPRCQIWDLHEPDVLEPLRAYDKARYHAGLPWDDRFAVAVQASLKMAQSSVGMEYGGEGPLAAIAPFTAELSKPDSILSDPVIANALRMMGPPKGWISEMARDLPGMNLQIPGTEEISGLAENFSGGAEMIDEPPWADPSTNVGPNVTPMPGGISNFPMGVDDNEDGPPLPAPRLRVTQVG